MICPSCDTPNRDDAKFCKKCGHSFRTEAVKVPEAAQVSQNSTSTWENAGTAEDIGPTVSAPEEALPGETGAPVPGSPEDRPMPTTPDPAADVPAVNLSSTTANEADTAPPEQEEEQGATPMPAEEPGTEGTTGDFPVLTVGTQLN